MTQKVTPARAVELTQWQSMCYTIGTGAVHAQGSGVRLTIGAQNGMSYSDAQLDDYSASSTMRWQPPVRLTIRARTSHPTDTLRGTCGFGFWNDPLGMTAGQTNRAWLPRVRLPQAVWFFFAAPPSNMPWAKGVAGTGWKAATLDAARWWIWLLLPFAPFAMLLCRLPKVYARLWPFAQWLLKIDERIITAPLEEWHDYCLEWDRHEMRFAVDGVEVLRTAHSPRGPLGLVIWIDNQYLVATPQGVIRQGVVASSEQWLEVASLHVTSIDDDVS